MIQVKEEKTSDVDRRGKAAEAADTREGLSGRDLDAAVAERVMDWRWWRTKAPSGKVRRGLMQPDITLSERWELADGSEDEFEGDNSFMPRYSSDIAAAMEVVTKMALPPHDLYVTMEVYQNEQRFSFRCRFDDADDSDPVGSSGGDSLAEAICRAALAAIDSTG